jgi:hypothetical protein
MRLFCSVSVCVTPIVARQQLGKHIPAATNTHAAIEEKLDSSFLCDAYRIKGGIILPRNFCLVLFNLHNILIVGDNWYGIIGTAASYGLD